jgi:hypothetical protein
VQMISTKFYEYEQFLLNLRDYSIICIISWWYLWWYIAGPPFQHFRGVEVFSRSNETCRSVVKSEPTDMERQSPKVSSAIFWRILRESFENSSLKLSILRECFTNAHNSP